MNCLTERVGNMNLNDFTSNRGYDVIPQKPIDRLKPLRESKTKRQNTFQNFPRNAQVSVEELLNDGFFYIGDGENDRVQCAFCGGIFKNWHEGDNVHLEHKRVFSRCPLAGAQSTPQFLSFGENQVDHASKNSANFGNLRVDAVSSNLECNDLEADAAPIVVERPRHPQYSTKATRLSTFKSWPETMKQKPEDLAEAGLFYTGESDKALCYFCGGALVEWEAEDIPAPEHDNWFPDCVLAKQRKAGK